MRDTSLTGEAEGHTETTAEVWRDAYLRPDSGAAGDATAATHRVRGPRLSPLTRRRIAFHSIVALATLFVIRVLGAGWAGGFPITFPDSSSYLDVARLGPFAPSFWFDERAVGFPLFTWIVGRSVRLTVLAQTVVYVAAFAGLIVVVWRSLQSSTARVAAAVLIAAIATQPRFAMWNPLMLSESLSLSVGVATVAAWWWFVSGPDRKRAVAATVITACWLVVRDSNLIPVVGAAVPALLIGWRLASSIPADVRRSLVRSAGCLLLVGGYLFIAQDVTERTRYAVFNNVGMRVLPDESMTDWWVDHGMPMSPALRAIEGNNSWDDGSAILTDPALAEFRAWAEGPAQRVQLQSAVVHFDFWFDSFRDDLPGLLAKPFAEYDNFDVAERLPTSWFGLTGPRSMVALGWWGAIAGVGVLASISRSSMRKQALIVAIGLGATAVESYLGHAADPMEPERHLVGPLCRFTVLLMLGAVLAVEYVATLRMARRAGAVDGQADVEALPSADSGELPPPAGDAAAGPDAAPADAVAGSGFGSRGRLSALARWAHRWQLRARSTLTSRRFWQPVAAAGLTVIITTFVLAAVFGNEFRSQNFDPKYMRVLVDRALQFGGSYYENGIHNKGPLEPLLYDLAARVGGADGSWLVLSIVVAVACGGLVVAVALSARAAGATGAVIAAVALGTAYHFLLSPADYAGSLYARQIVVTLLAVAWVVTIVDRCWSTRRRAVLSALAVGMLAGLAVQTILSSLFGAVIVVAVAIVIRGRLQSKAATYEVTAVTVGAAVAAVLTAPAWYAVRGTFDEFWSGWWTYASYSNSATGRPLAAQLGFGWDQAYAYYQRFPLSFVVVGAFGAATVLFWNEYGRRLRVLRVATVAWILAAWLELALSQRYSSHYFTVLAVPTWIAFAFLTGDAERLLRGRGHDLRTAVAVPVVAAVCFVFAGGATPLMDGVARASQFTSAGQLVERRQVFVGAPIVVEEAVLDLVSSRDDSLLAWTMEPWTYLDRHRVSATRFIWKSLLVGEIYLAGSGPQYVLPQTWEWFDDDMRQAQPLAYYQEPDLLPDPATPFAAYVEENFRPVLHSTNATIFLRRDVAGELLTGSDEASPWTPPDGDLPGWTMRTGIAQFQPGEALPPDAGPVVARGWCTSLAGTVDRTRAAQPEFTVLVTGAPGSSALARFTVAGGNVTGSTPTLTYEQPFAWAPRETSSFAILVGSRSVALVVDGEIRGALPLDPEDVADGEPVITITAAATELSLQAMTTEELDDVGTSGC